ncbi:hypothetical protein FSH49_014720 [Escherichia coli]|nr:hypothetical protein [Escherichia coli]
MEKKNRPLQAANSDIRVELQATEPDPLFLRRRFQACEFHGRAFYYLLFRHYDCRKAS